MQQHKLDDSSTQSASTHEEDTVDREGPAKLPPAEPFNPRAIKISRVLLSLDSVLKRMQRKTIILAPPYQRKEVWDPIKKSQLIESLMLKIPLPSFYVAEDDKGNYEVVDGLQRLTAIRDFLFSKDKTEKPLLGEGFRLEGLEHLKELETKNYNEIGDYYQQNIDENSLEFIVIDNKTPEEVKFVIFSRINRGGLSLTDQEVRHALYNGTASLLLEELSNNQMFVDNFSSAFTEKNMQDREVILRMLAFIVRQHTSYEQQKTMSNYLSETMLIINSMPSFDSFRFQRTFTDEQGRKDIRVNEVDQLKSLFTLGLDRSLKLFAEHTFRKSIGKQRRNRINKALFEAWGASLAMISETKFTKLISRKKIFINKYSSLLEDNTFSRSISSNALELPGVRNRYEKIREIIDEVSGDK